MTKLKNAFHTATKTWEEMKKERETRLSEAEKAEDEGDVQKAEELLKEAVNLDVAVSGITYSLSNNFGYFNMMKKKK